jgi:proteasome lid subunit RPN8/RPN11
MHQHAAKALPNETGGFLLGRVAHDHRDGCWHVEIEDAVPVDPLTQNPVQFTFTWRDVDRIRNYREEHGQTLLGWYHTHPDLGIFLSDTDLDKTHRVLFSAPFQIALVYDPVRCRAGYFFWEGPQKIDATQAGWREFDITVAPDASPAGEDDEARPDRPGTAAQDSTQPLVPISAGAAAPARPAPSPIPAAAPDPTQAVARPRAPGDTAPGVAADAHVRRRLQPAESPTVPAAPHIRSSSTGDTGPIPRPAAAGLPAPVPAQAAAAFSWTPILLGMIVVLLAIVAALLWFLPRGGSA